jgi:hypothetical protein
VVKAIGVIGALLLAASMLFLAGILHDIRLRGDRNFSLVELLDSDKTERVQSGASEAARFGFALGAGGLICIVGAIGFAIARRRKVPRAGDDPSLPRPLADPLYRARKVLPYVYALLIWLGVLLAISALPSQQGKIELPELLAGIAVSIILALPFIGLVLHILPKQPVNAFYLRSFRNDRRSWPVRKAIQTALGRAYRLSGIRDPRRRMPLVLRPLAFMIFLFRYSTPKFMNLEARADWQARLWRSLGAARCALIDLSDLTPFVEEEIHLCYHCLGPERVLFLGDPSRTVAEWRADVARVLSLDHTARDFLQVTLWENSRAGRRAFREAIASFAAQLPSGPAGLKRAFSVADRVPVLPAEAVRTEARAQWAQIVVGLILAGMVWWLYNTIEPSGWTGLLWLAPLGMAAYMFFLMIVYLIDCGSLRERVIVTAYLGVYVALLGGFLAVTLLPQIHRARETAYHVVTNSNLRQIGLAMMEYANAHAGAFPGHAIYNGPKPMLSWRVALLPFLEEEDLYRQFRLDEAWDSPHNKPLLKRMPKVYALPGSRGASDSTSYQVFVSPPGSPPRAQALFVDGPGPGRPLSAIPDGASATILVVEATAPVEWTRPDDLSFGSPGTSGIPGSPLPALGRESADDFHALFCDGSAHTFDKKINPDVLRALITPAGGEYEASENFFYRLSDR